MQCFFRLSLPPVAEKPTQVATKNSTGKLCKQFSHQGSLILPAHLKPFWFAFQTHFKEEQILPVTKSMRVLFAKKNTIYSSKSIGEFLVYMDRVLFSYRQRSTENIEAQMKARLRWYAILLLSVLKGFRNWLTETLIRKVTIIILILLTRKIEHKKSLATDTRLQSELVAGILIPSSSPWSGLYIQCLNQDLPPSLLSSHLKYIFPTFQHFLVWLEAMKKTLPVDKKLASAIF